MKIKKFTPTDFEVQIADLINKKYGCILSARQTCEELYPMFKAHIESQLGGSYPDGSQILPLNHYQIWHLPERDKQANITHRPLYCLIQMTEALKAATCEAEDSYFHSLLDMISCYEGYPEPITEWQCRLFVAFYELGLKTWPDGIVIPMHWLLEGQIIGRGLTAEDKEHLQAEGETPAEE